MSNEQALENELEMSGTNFEGQTPQQEKPQGESKEAEQPTSEEAPSGSNGTQSPFNHPLLRGKSPSEVEEYVKILEATTNEQKLMINQMHQRGGDPVSTPARPPEPELTDSDYYSNPVETTRRIIKSEMETMIAPFKQNLTESKTLENWSRLEAEVGPKVKTLRPLMEQLLTRHNISSPNYGQLQSYYYLALGLSTANNSEAPAATPPQPSAQPSGSNAPPLNPQHSASSRPLSGGAAPSQKLRPLTESEERLRRFYGMSHEEYLKEQDDGPMTMDLDKGN